MVSENARSKIVRASSREMWRMLHMATIGGSSAAAVLGKARFKTPRDLYDRMNMVLNKNKLPVEQPETGDLRRGILLEPLARQQLAEHYQISVESHDQDSFLYRDDAPWAHCLPDGWIGDDIAEIKCPRPGTVARVNIRGLFPEWEIQAQHNMHIARVHRPGCQRCYVGMFDAITCNIFVYPVAYDERFAEQLMLKERDFYESVKLQSPPPGGEEEVEELDPDIVALDDSESIELAKTWIRLKELEDDLEEAFESTKEKLTGRIGSHNGAVVGNIAKIRWKYNRPSRTLNKDVILAKHPEIAKDDECWKTSKASRPFVVTPIKEKFE